MALNAPKSGARFMTCCMCDVCLEISNKKLAHLVPQLPIGQIKHVPDLPVKLYEIGEIQPGHIYTDEKQQLEAWYEEENVKKAAFQNPLIPSIHR